MTEYSTIFVHDSTRRKSICITDTCPACTAALVLHNIFPCLSVHCCTTAQTSSASCWPPLWALRPFAADFLFSSRTQDVRQCWLCSNGLLLHGRTPPSGTIAVCNDAPCPALLSGGAAQPATKATLATTDTKTRRQAEGRIFPGLWIGVVLLTLLLSFCQSPMTCL